MGNVRVKGNVLTNLKNSFYEVRYWIYTTIQSLKMLVTRQVSPNELSGPVGIVKSIGDTYQQSVKKERVLLCTFEYAQLDDSFICESGRYESAAASGTGRRPAVISDY